jgi:hypothetical protein
VIAAGLRPRVVSRRSLRRQYGRRLRRTFIAGLIMARRRLVRAYAPGMATESSVPPGSAGVFPGAVRLRTGLVQGGGLEGPVAAYAERCLHNCTFAPHHCLLAEPRQAPHQPATCDLVPLGRSRGGDGHFDPDGDRLPLFAAADARLDEIRDSFTERDTQGNLRYRPAALYWFGTIAL